MILLNTVFWGMILWRLVEIFWHFRETQCLSYSGYSILKLEAVGASKTSVNFYWASWCRIQGDSILYSHLCENPISCVLLWKRNKFVAWTFCLYIPEWPLSNKCYGVIYHTCLMLGDHWGRLWSEITFLCSWKCFGLRLQSWHQFLLPLTYVHFFSCCLMQDNGSA
jgi:hypothetical protein